MTLKDEIEVLEKMKSQPQNISQRELEKAVYVPKVTVQRLLKQEINLRDEWASSQRDWKEAKIELALNK